MDQESICCPDVSMTRSISENPGLRIKEISILNQRQRWREEVHLSWKCQIHSPLYSRRNSLNKNIRSLPEHPWGTILFIWVLPMTMQKKRFRQMKKKRRFAA